MRKITATALLGFLGIISLSSCERVQNCVCVITYHQLGDNYTSDVYQIKGSKKKAEKPCKDREKSSEVYTIDCELK